MFLARRIETVPLMLTDRFLVIGPRTPGPAPAFADPLTPCGHYLSPSDQISHLGRFSAAFESPAIVARFSSLNRTVAGGSGGSR